MSRNHATAAPSNASRRRLLRAATAGLCLGTAAAYAVTGRESPAAPLRIALVLGGGGCRGFGHIGFIRGLEKAGYAPDIIVGSSAGSLVGALYAAGTSAADLERHGLALGGSALRSWTFPKLGFFGGHRIARFVRERVKPHAIEDLPRRYAAVTTDLRTGEQIVLDRGDVGVAVQASSSLPGLLEPVRIEGRYCVDGNLAAPVPVNAARRLGATYVIAVDVTFPPQQADLSDPFDALPKGFPSSRAG